MKRRFKLLSSIASLTAAVALLVFGVLAASDRNVNVSGTVTFTATNIEADINVYEAVAANKDAFTDGYGNALETFEYRLADTVADQKDIKEYELLGKDEGVQLNDEILFYTYKVTIENKFTEGSDIKITLTDAFNTNAAWLDGHDVVVTIDDENATLTEDAITIVPGEIATFVFAYTVKPASAGISESFNIGANFALDRVAA